MKHHFYLKRAKLPRLEFISNFLVDWWRKRAMEKERRVSEERGEERVGVEQSRRRAGRSGRKGNTA